jgi:hypothetical protein
MSAIGSDRRKGKGFPFAGERNADPASFIADVPS